FIDFERGRRAAIATSHLEIKGTLAIGAFTLSGIADRIDVLTSGGAAILDYKTGAAPSKKQVENLMSPQLPLEAAILASGGFGDIGSRATEALLYLSLASEKSARTPRLIDGAAELAKEAVDALQRRIAWFAEENTPYRSRVRPYRADIAGDYDHLARVREWSPSGWAEEE
ncbi:MAG: PD-(D/E)XK nuclease family protein, partial [Alphaproteobacteria bacterium]|nr:PD-(D/E)XK nuclease family protein [Alphaproteobacteria bacterium]